MRSRCVLIEENNKRTEPVYSFLTTTRLLKIKMKAKKQKAVVTKATPKDPFRCIYASSSETQFQLSVTHFIIII